VGRLVPAKSSSWPKLDGELALVEAERSRFLPSLIAILLTKVKKSQAIALAIMAALSVFLGALAFSIAEHLSFATSLYWAITTATTVGYGDVTPHNPAGRLIAVLEMLTAIPLFGSAFAFLAAAVTAERVAKLLRVREGAPKQDFVAIYGNHTSVARIAHEVIRAGERVLVVSDQEINGLPIRAELIHGDPTIEATLAKSEPHRATRLLIATADDKDALLIAVMLRHLAPDVPIIAVVSSTRVAQALADLGVTTTVSAEDLLGHTLAKSIETPHAGDFLLEIVRSTQFRFHETAVPEDYIGKRLSALRDVSEGLVLGVVHSGKVLIGIDEDPILSPDDTVLMLTKTQSKELSES
jgi:voltage-gated potassium channel